MDTKSPTTIKMRCTARWIQTTIKVRCVNCTMDTNYQNTLHCTVDSDNTEVRCINQQPLKYVTYHLHVRCIPETIIV